MKKIGSIFWSELKRFITFRKLIILFLAFCLCFYFAYRGEKEYRTTIVNSLEFQESEAYAFSIVLNYTQYAENGFHILYIPSATSIFFSTPVEFTELTARVNSAAAVDIYNNCKRKVAGKSDFPFNLSFSLIVILLGSPLAMLMGFPICRNREYNSFLYSASDSSPGTLFFATFFSRYIIISLCFLFIFGIILGVLILDGIVFTSADFSCLTKYAANTMLLFFIFMVAGSMIGKIKTEKAGFTLVVVVWTAAVFGLPTLSNIVIDDLSEEVASSYAVYKKKLEVLNNFERNVLKKYGKFNREKFLPVYREILKKYEKNEYAQMEAMETKIREAIAANVANYNTVSILNPISFYLQTCNSTSSFSYENFLSFYTYAQEIKLELLKHILNRRYYQDPNELVNFVKGDENIFPALSLSPPNYWSGFGIALLFNAILFFIALKLFEKSIFPTHKNTSAEDIAINLVPGKHMAFKLYYNHFIDNFLNALSGKSTDFKGKITLADTNIIDSDKNDFLYLPSPGKIPGDIRCYDFLVFLKRITKLSKEDFEGFLKDINKDIFRKRFENVENLDKAIILLEFAKVLNKPLCILNNITDGIYDEFHGKLKERTCRLKDNNSVVIEFFDTPFQWMETDSYSSIKFDGSKYVELKIRNL
ncbi:MAG: hypothetical protein GY757_39900 [bacterium]|nr:hypothetical protein [bacterium]